MTVSAIIKEISEDVDDVIATSFDYTNTTTVPNSHDTGLTFERATVKRGRQIDTCVLYVDVRNSVGLTAKHQSITMGRVYTAFIKAVIKIGRHHGASTRNIIGDRVMLVFPSEKCFDHAVNCAISINHIANKIIAKKFTGVDFKCGIGIDYGTLKVIKVGIQRNGTEKSENKGLVWTGNAANLASRITDLANKTLEHAYFKVKYKGYNFGLLAGLSGFPGFSSQRNKPGLGYSAFPDTYELDVKMEETEFASSLSMKTPGTINFSKGELISFERVVDKVTYSPIMFTQRVMDGLVRDGSLRAKDSWTEQPGPIRDVKDKVFGGGYTWQI